jgi:hypothetical protein
METHKSCHTLKKPAMPQFVETQARLMCCKDSSQTAAMSMPVWIQKGDMITLQAFAAGTAEGSHCWHCWHCFEGIEGLDGGD